MTKRTKNKIKIPEPSILKKVIVITGLFTCLFGGIILAVVAVGKFKNYDSPYLFTFATGGVGFVISLIVARKIKPFVLLNPAMEANYYQLEIMFSAGFVGCFLLAGHFFNSAISSLHNCGKYVVVEKQFDKGGYKRPARSILIINIENKDQVLLCSRQYWSKMSAGKTASVCIFKSPVAFDYLTLPDDK